MRTKIWEQRSMALPPGLQAIPVCGPAHPPGARSCPGVLLPLHLRTFLLFTVFWKIFLSSLFFSFSFFFIN